MGGKLQNKMRMRFSYILNLIRKKFSRQLELCETRTKEELFPFQGRNLKASGAIDDINEFRTIKQLQENYAKI